MRFLVKWDLVIGVFKVRPAIQFYQNYTKSSPFFLLNLPCILFKVSQRWKPVGSRFFDRPSSRLKQRSKYPFLQLKKRSKHQPKYTYVGYIINKSFYKKKNSISKSHLFKTLAEWFQAVTNMLWPLRRAHPGACLGGALCHAPLLRTSTQSKNVQNIR